MKNFFLLICTFFSLASCSDQGTTQQRSTDSTTTARNETIQQASSSDSASSSISCTTQIRKFLAWYKTNLNELDKINLVDLIGSGDTAQYRVNFTNAEKYIATLKKIRLLLRSVPAANNELLQRKRFATSQKQTKRRTT